MKPLILIFTVLTIFSGFHSIAQQQTLPRDGSVTGLKNDSIATQKSNSGRGSKNDSLTRPKTDSGRQVYPFNSIYVELLGQTVLGTSVNYERVLLHRKFYYLTAKAGFGGGVVYPISSLIAFPLMINSLFQVYKGLSVELGTGINMMFVNIEGGEGNDLGIWKNGNAPIPSGVIGLRYQGKKGFLFRFDFTSFTNFDEIYYFFGISFGYSFPRHPHKKTENHD